MPSQESSHVAIYTDGACDPNPGVGGWAAILLCKEQVKELSGGERDTTNNQMEMTAAIRGLEALTRPCKVTLLTDSQYLQKGITEWLPNWKRRNWKRSGGAVKNLDLWQRLDELTQTHQVTWKWVPGHAGEPFNERCDQLAREAAARVKKGPA